MIRERKKRKKNKLGDKKLKIVKMGWDIKQMNLAASSLGIQRVLHVTQIVLPIMPLITLVKMTLKKLNLKKKKKKAESARKYAE